MRLRPIPVASPHSSASSPVVTPEALSELILATVAEMQEDVATLELRAHEAAGAERAYRQSRATAYLATEGQVAEREAKADQVVAELRYAAKLAEDLKVAALEAVRCRRAKLSALQTLASSMRAELELTRTQP